MKMSIEKKESSSEINKTARRSFEEGLEEVKKRNYEDMRTLFQQDYEALQEARKRGIDVTKSFRVMRLGKEGNDPHYHLFVTRGEEKAVEEEMNVLNTSRFVVDNRAVEKYKLENKDVMRSNLEKVADSIEITKEKEKELMSSGDGLTNVVNILGYLAECIKKKMEE